MKEDLKLQLSVPVRYGKKSKEAPKKLPENLTAVHLQLKVHCALRWRNLNKKLRSLSKNNRDLTRKQKLFVL